jgi:hypothetical protein
MGAHMKTTIDLTDSVLEAAKAEATRRGTTLRNVVEAALRSYLATQAEAAVAPFRLRRHVYTGRGLHADAGDWARILDSSYEDRA